MQRLQVCAVIGLALAASGCAAGFGPRPCNVKPDEAEIVVIGDSILAFHAGSCASAPDVLGEELERPVRNAAKSGAKVAPGFAYIFGDIRNQYESSDWDWVVVEGGINDLVNDCDCGECDEVLDTLASEDGSSGEVPALVDAALADGARVALMGYYVMPQSASWGFGRCGEAIGALRDRYQRVADSRDDVIFVDPAEVMSFDADPDAYHRDEIHPSERGSVLLGQQLADAIRAAEAQ
ncbi:MAG: SGNH/GDSL hydrolase family protein [Myxococcales bacterium]|nr:SGNH/GDSL hydrolase family protein [Myxococcales bacterium]